MKQSVIKKTAILLSVMLCFTGCGKSAPTPENSSSVESSSAVSMAGSTADAAGAGSVPVSESEAEASSKEASSSSKAEETSSAAGSTGSRESAKEDSSRPAGESTPKPDNKPSGGSTKPAQPAKPDTPSHEDAPSKVEELSAKEELIRLVSSFRKVSGYKSEVSGQVNASGYKQQIHNTKIKNGNEAYLKAVSNSAFVNMTKEAYFSGNRVVEREKGAFSASSLDSYCSTNGNPPTEFSSYTINGGTIRDASIQRNQDGSFVITAYIDPVKGTGRYAAQMQTYGGLNGKPTFSECKIVVSCGADGMVQSLKSYDTYRISIPVLGKLNCTSQLTETFRYGKNSIPDRDAFRSHL